jgi:hypothetical protein
MTGVRPTATTTRSQDQLTLSGIDAWQGDYQLVPEPLLVAIDMGEITTR